MYSKTMERYELADTGVRLVAIMIDGIILAIIGGLLFGATRGHWGSGIAEFIVGLGYNWYFWTRSDGQTPGKRMMGIRVVKANGEPMNDADAIVRYVGYYINTFVFMLGWLWALVDSNRQGWHDKLVSTYVVKA